MNNNKTELKLLSYIESSELTNWQHKTELKLLSYIESSELTNWQYKNSRMEVV